MCSFDVESTLCHLLAQAVLDWQLDKHIGTHNVGLYVDILQALFRMSALR